MYIYIYIYIGEEEASSLAEQEAEAEAVEYNKMNSRDSTEAMDAVVEGLLQVFIVVL
jgi:hypothetical protein